MAGRAERAACQSLPYPSFFMPNSVLSQQYDDKILSAITMMFMLQPILLCSIEG